MATKGAKDDSTDSDDSMNGRRPSFSVEERALLHNLLKTSDEFLRLNEEHQPEIQQIITQLEERTEEVLDQHSKVTKAKRKAKIAAIVFAVSIGVTAASFVMTLLSLLTDDASVEGAVFTAVVGAVVGYVGFTKVQKRRRKEDVVKQTLKAFSSTAERIIESQHNACGLAEKILDCQNMFTLQSRQRESLRNRVEAVSELVKLFRPDELWKILKEKRSLDIKADMEKIGPPLHLMTKGRKTMKMKRKKKTKKQALIQEQQLESEEEQLDYKMRETENRLHKLIDELKASKAKVENRIVHKLNERFHQLR